MSVHHIHVCLVPMEAKKSGSVPWDWNERQSDALMVGIKSRPLGRTISAFNHQAISRAPRKSRAIVERKEMTCRLASLHMLLGSSHTSGCPTIPHPQMLQSWESFLHSWCLEVLCFLLLLSKGGGEEVPTPGSWQPICASLGLFLRSAAEVESSKLGCDPVLRLAMA